MLLVGVRALWLQTIKTPVKGYYMVSYLEYENLKEFYDWVLTLKPKDVRDKGISERGLQRT